MSTFSKQLEKLIADTKTNPTEVAIAIGESKESIEKYLSNEADPDYQIIAKLSAHFDLLEQYFFSDQPKDLFVQMRKYQNFFIDFFSLDDETQRFIKETVEGRLLLMASRQSKKNRYLSRATKRNNKSPR